MHKFNIPLKYPEGDEPMINLVAERLEKSYYLKNPSFIKKKNGYNYTDINSVIDFILAFIDLNPKITKIVETTSHKEILAIKEENLKNIVNLTWLNDINCLDKFFDNINKKLPVNGIFICRAETEGQRFKRIYNKFPKIIFYILYSFDFLIFRFLPKWGATKYLYYFLTKRDTKVLSLAHMLGFFVFYGFKINYIKDINNIAHFILEKVKEPSSNTKPSSGFLFKMKRIGKNGKIISIYKLRTMHPYSEYIQDFVYNLNGSGNGDKIMNDFRVASWGKFLRKYWLDELPMLINLLKGDIKIIGVRPLSAAKFSLYPPDLQLLRTSTKPGLIPPFYADLPKTFDELIESERKYIISYLKSPIKTDVKYFCKCCYNIIIKHARSA